MENKIILSIFKGSGIYTVIENPTLVVRALLNGISLEKPETYNGNEKQIAFYHKDIGTKEEMEILFRNLELACYESTQP